MLEEFEIHWIIVAVKDMTGASNRGFHFISFLLTSEFSIVQELLGLQVVFLLWNFLHFFFCLGGLLISFFGCVGVLGDLWNACFWLLSSGVNCSYKITQGGWEVALGGKLDPVPGFMLLPSSGFLYYKKEGMLLINEETTAVFLFALNCPARTALLFARWWPFPI